MKRLVFIYSFMVMIALGLSGVPKTALALDVDTARANGQVIELYNGYLKAADGVSGDVQALVQSVNAKRKALFQKEASKQGVPLQSVEQIFGDQIFQKGQPGLYQRIDGSIVRK